MTLLYNFGYQLVRPGYAPRAFDADKTTKTDQRVIRDIYDTAQGFRYLIIQTQLCSQSVKWRYINKNRPKSHKINIRRCCCISVSNYSAPVMLPER